LRDQREAWKQKTSRLRQNGEWRHHTNPGENNSSGWPHPSHWRRSDSEKIGVRRAQSNRYPDLGLKPYSRLPKLSLSGIGSL